MTTSHGPTNFGRRVVLFTLMDVESRLIQEDDGRRRHGRIFTLLAKVVDLSKCTQMQSGWGSQPNREIILLFSSQGKVREFEKMPQIRKKSGNFDLPVSTSCVSTKTGNQIRRARYVHNAIRVKIQK